MATQESALPFAIDADITPLQARYFESAQRNITDPRARLQTYDLLRRSFGGLQAAREAVAARDAQAAERAAADEFNRLRLESGRFELINAREKAARERAQAEQFRGFASQMQGLANDTTKSVDERIKAVSNIAATAASAGVDVGPLYRYTTASITGKPESTRAEDKGPTFRSTEIENLVETGRDKELLESGVSPLQIDAARQNITKKAAERAAASAKSVASSSIADSVLKTYAKVKPGDAASALVDEIADLDNTDTLISQLDAVGALTKKDKERLYKAGLYVPGGPKEFGEKGSWEKPQNIKDRRDTILEIVNRARVGQVGGAQPAKPNIGSMFVD